MGGSGSTPRRRSREYPPDFSELMNKLIKHSSSFIREFDSREQKMREIVRKFREIPDEVREMQKRTDEVRTVGAVTAAVGIGAGGVGIGAVLLGFSVLAAPFTGGVSLLAAGGALTAAGGGVAAVGGGAVVVGANVRKILIEVESAKKVNDLGKEFRKMVELLKKDLEEIKWTCGKLEKRSAELQAGKTLRDMEELQRSLRRVSEDRREILRLADLGSRVVDDCEKMKKELKDFT